MRDSAWWRARGVHVGAGDGTGLTPSTSHPAFVAVAPESFYDEADAFAPFGSDSGHDALGRLEDWYMTASAADGEVPAFLINMLADFGDQIPAGLWSSDSGVARAWAATGDDTFVAAAAQKAVAVAIGQLKIRGHITSAVRRIGWQAVTLQRALVEQAGVRYPSWGRADAATAGIDAVVRVLTSAPSPGQS